MKPKPPQPPSPEVLARMLKLIDSGEAPTPVLARYMAEKDIKALAARCRMGKNAKSVAKRSREITAKHGIPGAWLGLTETRRRAS